ncbi:MAG: sugar kinase [Hydrococcus sp. C42_A2020_068]|uniref:sugar kinase n=1 Tax=Pleurocapsa sp. PCC 7327 TaxID=118163 RepID=UPI00029FB55D|nr:sugar kinase [Pleurocapsa sp. PCC 7327]AFY79050.1 sugar kinase, ribokinase [Pleurocapsa sp. PCC 7327]MBF2022802.1 sugar kinase [Hydrococcus sp. C42_A2020_068]
MKRHGLFVGLSTLDFIYLTKNIPETNQKIVALDQTIAAGGPATNAAVTFSYLGDRATLLSVIGNHSISQIIRCDLETYSVKIVDLAPNRTELPSVSSIIVTQSTGERAVISANATKFQAIPEQIPSDILQDIELILIDGHQMALSVAIAQQARVRNIPVAIDGGSWKSGFEEVLPFVDYAICSANFYPPNCYNQEDVFIYLQQIGIPHIAITQGENPIQYLSQGEKGEIEIPTIKAIDTLGAGDIFHGAFCHYILQKNFIDALSCATQVASYSCQFFGTRQWMQ